MRPLTACRMAALGEEFRRAREARGQTISDVAERLHIRSVYLTAIEDEDWAAIGAPVYIRGFMRTYARYLGLDPEAAVARFTEAPATARGPAPAPAREERKGGRPSAGALVAIVVAVLLVGFVGYQYVAVHSDQSPAVPVVRASVPPAEPAPSAATAAAAPAVEAESPPAGAALPTPAGDKPKLAIRVTQTSWLRVVVDGKVALEGTYPPGTVKTFAGKSALVRVGNAGGVQIAVGGRPVGRLGADGDVVERHFTMSGE
jgi:cytoskeleton protein RodZ